MGIESQCRQSWVDPFHAKIQLETCVRQSILDMNGSARQSISDWKSNRQAGQSFLDQLNGAAGRGGGSRDGRII